MPTATATAAETERREVARALLRWSVLTAAEHPEELARARKHAAALKGIFSSVLGYPLVVEASFARLIKAPLSEDAPSRILPRSATSDFTSRTYTYLSLLCAGLLAPDVGEQVLASSLVEQLRADAATAGIALEETASEARHLVAAFRLLTSWGVVEETDGTIAGYEERDEEALISVHRQMLPHLLARPLASLPGPDALLGIDPDLTPQPRRSLRRKLVENPLVRREDLTEAERDVLSRERRELSRMLEDSFGLSLEVRAEGALAYDAEAELTDIEFPGSGTVRQAALLLLDRLIADNRPRPGTTFDLDGAALPGLLCRWNEVDRAIGELADAHAKAWRQDYVFERELLREHTVALLDQLCLATPLEAGLAIHPAAARYRPSVETAPTKTRARRRLDQDDAGPSLFDSAEEA